MARLDLAEVMQDLRDELETAVTAAAASGSNLQFGVGPVELTIQVEITKEAKAGAKAKFWVIEAGADATLTKATTQQIKLTLTPLDATDPDAPPAPPGSVRIAGTSVPGER